MAIMAELNDGTEIELEKDCGCITHEGPHWLHMDRLTHSLNIGMLPTEESTEGIAVAHCFIESEIRRLAKKNENFERLNIKRIFEI